MSTSSTIPSNTTTCVNCRKSKTRCTGGYPCTRCTTRKSPCVPTGSKFTKKKKTTSTKRKRGHHEKTSSTTTRTNKFQPEDSISKQAHQSVQWSGTLEPKSHFGLNWLVRHWFALAIRRRSTSLLSKAFGLASAIGLSMDEMIIPNDNGDNATERMATITQLLLTKKSLQTVNLPRISFNNLPMSFQQILNRPHSKTVEERWVLVRHDVDGQMGLYMSNAFVQEICPYDVARKTFEENLKAVVSLWQPDNLMEQGSAEAKGLGALICQNDTKSGLPVRPFYVRQRIKTLKGKEVNVTLMSTMIFADCCDSWMMKEYLVGTDTSNPPCVSLEKCAGVNVSEKDSSSSSSSSRNSSSSNSSSNNSSSYSASSVSVPNENSFEEIQERIGGDGSIQQNGIYGGWDEDLEQLLSYHNTDLEAEEDALALLDMFDE